MVSVQILLGEAAFKQTTKKLCPAGQKVVSRGANAERTLRTSFCLDMVLLGKTGINTIRSGFAW